MEYGTFFSKLCCGVRDLRYWWVGLFSISLFGCGTYGENGALVEEEPELNPMLKRHCGWELNHVHQRLSA
jgi:hypothetical protein